MKKLLTLVTLFTFGFNTYAQDASTSKDFRFGIKASPTLAWLKTKSNDLDKDGSSFGFSYGLMADFNIGNNYAFATGIEVSHKGGSIVYNDDPSNPQFSKPIILAYKPGNVDSANYKKAEYSLQYIEIPLTIKMKTKEIGYLTYYAQVGIAPSISIGAKAKDITYNYKDTLGFVQYIHSDQDADVGKNITDIGLSMIIAAGVEYGISGDTKLVAGFTFNNGFTDVLARNKSEYADYNEKATANFIALNIGVFF